MIFVTVGTQGSFDRLVTAMDEWAREHPETDVFAQIGPSESEPEHFDFQRDLEPADFQRHLENASAVVAHAGCGTILSALELGKPVVVMPRRADLGEHRNDHQVATAERFADLERVRAVEDTAALHRVLDELADLEPAARIDAGAQTELLDRIRSFIDG